MPKQLIRDRMLDRRRRCEPSLRRQLDHAIQERFLELEVFAAARCLALYSPVRYEVDTTQVVRAAQDAGKTTLFPKVVDDMLVFSEVADPAHLVPGTFNVPEPTGDAFHDPAEIDLCIVPGVAFDRRGHRLGYGRGFYDRFLPLCRREMPRVGFAYDFQVVNQLPVGDYDQTLSMVVTETRTLDFCR